MVPLKYMNTKIVYDLHCLFVHQRYKSTFGRVQKSCIKGQAGFFLLNPSVYDPVGTPYRICLHQSNAFKCGEKYTLGKNWMHAVDLTNSSVQLT